MSDEDKPRPEAVAAPKNPYEAPAIRFEHPTEALAGVCDGTSNCPSKQSGATTCDTFDACTSFNS